MELIQDKVSIGTAFRLVFLVFVAVVARISSNVGVVVCWPFCLFLFLFSLRLIAP